MTRGYTINDDAVTAAPPPFPPAQPLHGDAISLLPLTDDPAVFEQLHACSHGDATLETVWDYLPYGPVPDANAMRECYMQMAAGGDPQFFAVHHHESNLLAGIMSYLRIAPAAYSIEIGHIWHAAPQQRGRANTEACYLLIDNAFTLGYRRMEWKCNALNDRSRQAALRLGLAFEGIFRQQVVFKGKNRDTAWFAIIDKDWDEAKGNFRQWLDAEAGSVSLAALNLPLVEWSLPAHDGYPGVGG